MANLEDVLKSIDKEKVEKLKRKLDQGNLTDMLASVDADKAKKVIEKLNLSEQLKNVDLGKFVDEVKKNPGMIDELKKHI